MATTASEEMIVVAGIAGMSFAFEPHEINFHPSAEAVNRVSFTLKGVSASDLDKLIALKDSGATFEVKHYLPAAPVLVLERAQLVGVSPGEAGSVANGLVLFKTVGIEYRECSTL